MIGLVVEKKKKGNLFLRFWLILFFFFWKKKKGSCFSERKGIWLFLFSKEKKRKFIFKILVDSVFLEGKKKDHVF